MDKVDSTSNEARRLYESGRYDDIWITADQQTQGRGRAGRVWQSARGNLFATRLVRFPVSLPVAPQAGFVAGLSLFDTVFDIAGSRAAIALKWPNDVLADDNKIAGILTETIAADTGKGVVLAVGMGVNIASSPSGTDFPACSLARLGIDISPCELFERLADSFSRWTGLWHNGGRFDLIIKAWQERAAWLGQTVTVVHGSGKATGVFASLAPDGALVLQMPDDSRRMFHAGDVSLRKNDAAQ